MTLSIIIPAYNEGNTIHLILDKIKQVSLVGGLQKEIIIVNDCYRDHTEKALRSYMEANADMKTLYYKHEVNKGKGGCASYWDQESH
jgi:glycosyltransferase involved in cell wall biosynthesis